MEKVIGPIDGYYVAIVARRIEGKFRGSYKVCAIAPADYGSAHPLRRRRIAGLMDTPVEAMEIAEQMARLSIARLRQEDQARDLGKLARMQAAVEFDSSIREDATDDAVGRLFAPTEPAPLYAATLPAPLYPATEPAPLYAATMPCPLR
jgi:hypothetical protein